jgi:hypothetical protein
MVGERGVIKMRSRYVLTLILIGMAAPALGQIFEECMALAAEPYSCIELCGFSTESQLEDFLISADVVSIEDIGEGITEPRRVTLSKDGRNCRAIFKTVDIESTDMHYTNRFEAVFSDKYAYEVAAYRLDRMLAIGLVPVTVIREIDGELGSLQYWIENAVNLQDAADAELPVGNMDLLLQRLMLTYVFDAMIYNIDRNFNNILVRPASDDFFLIDHSRAFRTHRKLPALEDPREIPLPRRVAIGLKGTDLTTLESELDGLLSNQQIRAIDRRRQQLIRELDRRGLLPAAV